MLAAAFEPSVQVLITHDGIEFGLLMRLQSRSGIIAVDHRAGGPDKLRPPVKSPRQERLFQTPTDQLKQFQNDMKS